MSELEFFCQVGFSKVVVLGLALTLVYCNSNGFKFISHLLNIEGPLRVCSDWKLPLLEYLTETSWDLEIFGLHVS